LNIANQLTLSRIIAVPFLLYILGNPEIIPHSKIVSFIIYGLITFTDFLDGFLARKLNLVSNFGKLMDPLADKILVLSLLLFYVDKGLIAYYWVALIIFREMAVLGLRSLAALSNTIIKADQLGKVKTVLQMALIGWLISEVPRPEILLYITVAITLLSGLNYFISNREVLHGN
jgi:CDP-diacylglycerol---glycerol-3-phosphate 3-phosphatidyltransferase